MLWDFIPEPIPIKNAAATIIISTAITQFKFDFKMLFKMKTKKDKSSKIVAWTDHKLNQQICSVTCEFFSSNLHLGTIQRFKCYVMQGVRFPGEFFLQRNTIQRY